jgi:hypothetical protein
MNAVLKKMSRTQKLRAMEELWSDLTRDESKYNSPSWHFDELARTEQAIKSGEVKSIGWDAAKKSMRRKAR